MKDDDIDPRDIMRSGTSRQLDLAILEEPLKKTSIDLRGALRFALSKMLYNALDEDASLIEIELQSEGEFYRLTISDNGKRKLKNEEEVKLIFDFKNKTSWKRGILAVSRGYLRNSLKCILRFVYSLADLKGLEAPSAIVRSARTPINFSLG